MSVTSSLILLYMVLWSAIPTFNLEVKERIVVPNEYVRMSIGANRCDADGNLYIIPAGGRSPIATGLLKISSDGSKLVHFRIASDPEMKDTVPADYTIGANGEVYILALSHGVPYVVRFDSDGEYESTKALSVKGVTASQIAAFGTGNLFVAGRLVEEHRAFAGVFSENGQLLKTVHLERNRNGSQSSEDYDTSLDVSMAEAGDDGNVYLARGTPEGPVFVISPSGQVRNILRLSPPANDLHLFAMKESHGRIALRFEGEPQPGETSPVWITVLDGSTGKEVARYFEQSFAIGVSLACYEPETFTFLTPDEDGRLVIVRAAAR